MGNFLPIRLAGAAAILVLEFRVSLRWQNTAITPARRSALGAKPWELVFIKRPTPLPARFLSHSLADTRSPWDESALVR